MPKCTPSFPSFPTNHSNQSKISNGRFELSTSLAELNQTPCLSSLLLA